MKVCVYCASSNSVHDDYYRVARELGRTLAEAGAEIAYGGGSVGSMGHLADGALSVGGVVEGVLPRFMHELEWGHPNVTRLTIVESMHERKATMIREADAVIALPGGCGTFEELFEALTWKRLGLYLKPIVLVNTRDYFAPCIELLERAVGESFMDDRHRAMWQVVDGPDQVLAAIDSAPPWGDAARNFAVPR